MGRNLRNTNKLKTRQPLKELLVITKHPEDRKTVERFSDILSAELNVKKVSFSSEESKWVTMAAKPNSKALGPRLGQKMKAVSQKIRELTADQVSELVEKGSLTLEGEAITPNDVEITRQPKQAGLIQSLGQLTIWLDTALDPALVNEGRARELVNRVQKLRKDLNFEVTDRISVVYHCNDELTKAFSDHKSYITSETLAQKFERGEAGASWTAEQEIDDLPLKLFVQKI